VYGILTLATLVGAGLILVLEEYVFGICGLGIASVFGLLFLDAHGHLQEVRNRPVGLLAPHISEFLRPKESETKRPT
jgi:hypothetical protein